MRARAGRESCLPLARAGRSCCAASTRRWTLGGRAARPRDARGVHQARNVPPAQCLRAHALVGSGVAGWFVRAGAGRLGQGAPSGFADLARAAGHPFAPLVDHHQPFYSIPGGARSARAGRRRRCAACRAPPVPPSLAHASSAAVAILGTRTNAPSAAGACASISSRPPNVCARSARGALPSEPAAARSAGGTPSTSTSASWPNHCTTLAILGPQSATCDVRGGRDGGGVKRRAGARVACPPTRPPPAQPPARAHLLVGHLNLGHARQLPHVRRLHLLLLLLLAQRAAAAARRAAAACGSAGQRLQPPPRTGAPCPPPESGQRRLQQRAGWHGGNHCGVLRLALLLLLLLLQHPSDGTGRPIAWRSAARAGTRPMLQARAAATRAKQTSPACCLHDHSNGT